MSVHMKNYVYEVLERKENDIVVGDGSISFELLKRDGKRLDGAPAIAGRRVGCFYWNYDRSTAKLGGYTMQAFYPDMYEYNGRIYFVYGEVENLGGKYPLNRFLWEEERDFWVFLDTLDQQERDYCVKGSGGNRK